MLTDKAKQAWSCSFVGHSVMVKEIDRAMEAAGVCGLEVYDLLLNLELAPHMKLKMCDLADAVLLSRSGLTRLVDRLEKKGYIKREGCTHDRRSTFAKLTDKGLLAREEAWPVFRDQIEKLFASHVSEAEQEMITTAYSRMIRPFRNWDSEMLCSESA